MERLEQWNNVRNKENKRKEAFIFMSIRYAIEAHIDQSLRTQFPIAISGAVP